MGTIAFTFERRDVYLVVMALLNMDFDYRYWKERGQEFAAIIVPESKRELVLGEVALIQRSHPLLKIVAIAKADGATLQD